MAIRREEKPQQGHKNTGLAEESGEERGKENSQGKPKKNYEIEIYRAWCKECGLCVEFCPRQVLSRNETGGPQVVRPERCTGCGWCELHCPDFAISVHEKKAGLPEE